MNNDVTYFAIVQRGRLAFEALLLAASWARSNPDRQLTFMEPQPGPLWAADPRIPDDIREMLIELGAAVRPFENLHFGDVYPIGNKIEALATLPSGKPFVFLDTDTLVTGSFGDVPFDFARPTASMRREGTWPKGELEGTWSPLYARFGLDFESSLDLSYPKDDWRRYLYFNAGVFFGANPQEFGSRFLEIALSLRDDPPAGQVIYPWLDQIALPLVIHQFGGGRNTLPKGLIDGSVTCHYRNFPLLYARESDAIVSLLEDISAPNRLKQLLKQYEPAKRLIYQGKGRVVRTLFVGGLPGTEKEIRKRIKAAGLWLR